MSATSAHIATTIRRLLIAHAEVCKAEGSGDSSFLDPVPELLRRAQISLDAARKNAKHL